MANNFQYVHDGETYSEDDLTKVAESKNVSVSQLLKNNPEIKKTIKPISQQELIDARFSVGGDEFTLNDISTAAESKNQSIEEFLIANKDKITTTSRIGDFLGLDKGISGVISDTNVTPPPAISKWGRLAKFRK